MRMIESSDKVAIQLLKNRKVDFSTIVENIRPVVQEVKEQGDAAIKRYIKKFDGKEVTKFQVDNIKISEAIHQLPINLVASMQLAKSNIMKFHAGQMPGEKWLEILPGIRAGQIVRPIERVGCYIPGGRYPLISTVLMTVLPAKVAGVKEVVVFTPNARSEILAACHLCGVDEVYEVGGAMAIAAMAYGTETIEKVDKIVGPGNLYVSAAKKIVFGDVGTDFLAGPSEIVIIADQKSDASCIAADMIAQAEHDPASMSICITPSRALGNEVLTCIERQLEQLSTRGTAQSSLEARGAVIMTQSMEEAFAISNFLAPEHLAIYVEDEDLLSLVQNAGSIFLGKYSPVAAADYASGTNHVLPTGGFAAAQSGLSVRDFIKMPTVQRLTLEGLKGIASAVITLADAEGLAGHSQSIKERIKC